jgi:protein-tyrosine-phosphatase
MAECIANGLNLQKFIFTSAGINPQPVTSQTKAFLEAKGFDTSRLTSKELRQVPNLDHYHVVVLLAKEAEKAFPPNPHKLVLLDWTMADPAQSTGTAEEISAAHEAAFRFLQGHISDLVQALQGDEDE